MVVTIVGRSLTSGVVTSRRSTFLSTTEARYPRMRPPAESRRFLNSLCGGSVVKGVRVGDRNTEEGDSV